MSALIFNTKTPVKYIHPGKVLTLFCPKLLILLGAK